jgi:UDP-3-O-[3-hydroxymyristoyl] glucosamine N-acyltransferase
MKLSEIATALQARLIGDGGIEIDRPVHPADAESARDLALAMEPSALAALAESRARAALVVEGAKVPDGRLDGQIVVVRPRYAMANLLELFERPPHVERGIHPTASIAKGAVLGAEVAVGPFVYIGPGARIGKGTRILAHVTVGAEAVVGERCLFHPGVRVGERVVIGNRVILHNNASIGADGFSYATPERSSVETVKQTGSVAATNRELTRINSIGTVILADDVEVGACSTIDRGTVSATRVGRNTKIDDLVMVGHNCVIGENCMLCGQSGLAGSCRVGDRVVLGGQVGVADHISIGDDCVIGGGTGIGRNVQPRSVLLGYPPLPPGEAHALFLNAMRLGRLFKDVEELKRRLPPAAGGADAAE